MTPTAAVKLLRTSAASCLIAGPSGETIRNALPDDLRDLSKLPWQTIGSHLEALGWTNEKTEAISKQYSCDIPLDRLVFESIAIIHTTGSTADPKAIIASNNGIMANIPICRHYESRILLTPQSHGYSWLAGILSLSGGNPIFIYPGAPYTLANLQKLIQIVAGKADNFCAVPMFIKLLLSAPDGLASLKSFKTVTICGGQVSDHTARELVDVRVWSALQASEVGHMMDSGETKTTDWEWVSMPKAAEIWMTMEPQDDSTYELIIKKGHPALSVVNRDDGYATRDLYIKHPSIPGKWKYWRRKDDILVHSSGMKTDPIFSECKVLRSFDWDIEHAGQSRINSARLRSSAALSYSEGVTQSPQP